MQNVGVEDAKLLATHSWRIISTERGSDENPEEGEVIHLYCVTCGYHYSQCIFKYGSVVGFFLRTGSSKESEDIKCCDDCILVKTMG